LLHSQDDSEPTVGGTVRGAAFKLLCHAGSSEPELLGRLWATLSIETIEAVATDAQFREGMYELVKRWGAELTPHLRPWLRQSSPTLLVGLLDTFWHCPALADSLRDEISPLIESDHPAVRSSSIEALGSTSSFDALWKPVASHLADPDPAVRFAAARFLTRCKPRVEVAEMALQLYEDTAPVEDRLTLALVLARHALGSPQGLPVLIEAARSRVYREYDLAEQFLADLHAVQPIPELLDLVSDETVGLGALRDAFAAGLRSGNLNIAEFTKAVLVWLSSTQTRERLAAAYFLGSRPDEIAVEDDRLPGLLHDCLRDDDPLLQVWAAYAIVAMRSIRQTKCRRGP